MRTMYEIKKHTGGKRKRSGGAELSFVDERCSLITAAPLSWGPGAVIEFFTRLCKRRRTISEDRHENMVLTT